MARLRRFRFSSNKCKKKELSLSSIDSNKSKEKAEEVFLSRARTKAAEEEFKGFYEQWFNTEKAVFDVEAAMNQICKFIDERFYPYQTEFSLQGIFLEEKIYYRSIENSSFGCRIELKNSESARHLNESPYKIFLDVILFRKVFITHQIRYPDDRLDDMLFYPDINFERVVIWKDCRDETKVFTSKEIANDFFNLFLSTGQK